MIEWWVANYRYVDYAHTSAAALRKLENAETEGGYCLTILRRDYPNGWKIWHYLPIMDKGVPNG